MKQPLGLPRGSVRAVLSLLLVGTSCFLFATGTPVPDALLVLDGTALAFYFDTRGKEGTEEFPPAPAGVDPDAE